MDVVIVAYFFFVLAGPFGPPLVSEPFESREECWIYQESPSRRDRTPAAAS